MLGCGRAPWGSGSAPGRASQLCSLMAPVVQPGAPSPGRVHPTALGARMLRDLSRPEEFCHRTKSVTLCVTRAPWPARSARATRACADLMRDSVLSPKVTTQPRRRPFCSERWHNQIRALETILVDFLVKITKWHVVVSVHQLVTNRAEMVILLATILVNLII